MVRKSCTKNLCCVITSDRPKQDFMAETETLRKLKLMIFCILESMCTFQIIKEICYKCLTCFFLLVCKQ